MEEAEQRQTSGFLSSGLSHVRVLAQNSRFVDHLITLRSAERKIVLLASSSSRTGKKFVAKSFLNSKASYYSGRFF